MLNDFFAATAWPMETMAPYSFAHIALALAGSLAAALLAAFLAFLAFLAASWSYLTFQNLSLA